MGNSQQFNMETGFSWNQGRTDDFVMTHGNLSAPSQNDSVLSNRINLPLNQALVWSQDQILNMRNPEPDER